MHIGLMPQGGSAWLGGAHYIANLCGALAALPQAEREGLRVSILNQQTGFDPVPTHARAWMRAVDWAAEAPQPSLWRRQKYRIQRLGHRARTPWFDEAMREWGVDFVYPYVPPTHGARGYACAAWQPDFQHREMPDMFSAAECIERDAAVRAGLARADRLVLSSQAARADCERHFGAQGSRVQVLPFASVLPPDSGPPDAVARYRLPERYFICCNQFWAHKNHDLILQALADLRESAPEACVVFTGHTHDYRRPGHFDEWMAQVHRLGLWSQVRVLGVVPRADQLNLMRHSLGVIQPSRFEGWSTVVEDARALGCTMALSDIAVHREQAPERASYFGVDASDALADWMAGRLAAPLSSPLPWAEAQAAQAARLLGVARRFVDIARNVVRQTGGSA